ncbi:MAG: polysaccharide deacetylase family protein [Clostridiales bacterium]|jgi:peptidoglycan/xylan/chitin deacetylase (PgdA/CDA1 family)|nr:polysaccharide deacetylase family protein [Clostridiales bacterium]
MAKASNAVLSFLFITAFLLYTGSSENTSAALGQAESAYLTRAEAAEILSKAIFSVDTASNVRFADVPEDSPYFSYISNVAAASLMTGDGNGRFLPHDPITREQSAVVLYKTFKGYLDNQAWHTFNDSGIISAWAVEAVSILAGNGVAAGYPDGNFRPQARVTKREFDVMMARVYAMTDEYYSDSVQAHSAVSYTYQYDSYNAIIDYNSHLLCYVLYPVLGLPDVDRVIAEWAKNTYDSAKEEIRRVHQTYPNAKGELNVQYTATPVADGYIKIEEIGYYSASWLNRPREFVQVFHVDLKQNKLTDLDSIPQTSPAPGLAMPTDTPAPAPPVSTPGSADIDPNKPMLALTFDDGPSNYTPRLLEILRYNNVRGTFFVVGNRIASYKSTMRQILEEGSEIMGHSWDHRELTKLTDSQIKKDLTDTNDAIFAAVNIRPKMFRAPYGSVNDRVKAISKELGLTIVQWSVDTLDWKTRNADAVYNEVMKSANSGAIILTHDIHPTTVDAMERIIPELKRRGYQLVTVSELMSFSGKDIGPGNVIYRQ